MSGRQKCDMRSCGIGGVRPGVGDVARFVRYLSSTRLHCWEGWTTPLKSPFLYEPRVQPVVL